MQLTKLSKYLIIAMVFLTMAFSCLGGPTNSPPLVTLPSSLPSTTLSLYSPGELEIRTAAAYNPLDNTPLSLTSVTKWDLFAPNLGLGAVLGENNSQSTTATSLLMGSIEYRFIFAANLDVATGASVGYDFKNVTILGEIHGLLEFRMTKNSGTFTGVSMPFEKKYFDINKMDIMPVAGVTFSFP